MQSLNKRDLNNDKKHINLINLSEIQKETGDKPK